MAVPPKKRLIPGTQLNAALIGDLHRMNPWWTGDAAKQTPKTRRHLVGWMQWRLRQKLAPIVVVRGPRQIGKTTAQFQVIDDLLAEGVTPNRIMRVQYEDGSELSRLTEPVLRVVEWYEEVVLENTLNNAASMGQGVYLFLDEVQNLKGWDSQLKHLVDSSTVQVVVTGSSALRIEAGRDSLSGRITTIEAGVLSLTEIAAFKNLDAGSPHLADNGLEPLLDIEWWRDLAVRGGEDVSTAFRAFSDRGGYPLAHQHADIDWPRIANQLNENVIRRVIQHDLRVSDRGRKRDAALLEELFRLACRYIGQSPGPTTLTREVRRAMGSDVGVQKVREYLRFLDNTLLIRVVPPLEIRLKKVKGFPKLCLADHALRASWLQESIPLDPDQLLQQPHMSDLAGHVAESVTGTLFASVDGLDVAHLPARNEQPEIDFVVTIGDKRIPVEVKYRQRIDPMRDTEGLRTFVETAVNNAPFAIIVTMRPGDGISDPRIIPVPLSSLLLMR
ncbi:MAG: ATP-binding protein [Planctomycetota bacterium]